MNKTKLEKYLKLYKESFAGSETAEKDAQNERAINKHGLVVTDFIA